MSVFQANQTIHNPKWMGADPRPQFVMRVFKNDLLSVVWDGVRRVLVVRQLDISHGRLKLTSHTYAGSPDAWKTDPYTLLVATFATLKKMNALKVRVDEMGRSGA